MRLIILSILCSWSLMAQEAVVYQADPSPGVVFGTPFSGTNDGPSAFSGDGIQLAGTERIITKVSVSLFQRNMTNFIPKDITVRLYTDCPSAGTGGAEGACGADGAGTLIPGSEVTKRIAVEPTIGGLFTIDMPNIDVSSETDDTIWVVFNVPSNDILGVLNGVPTVGMQAASEINAISRCSTGDGSSGCSEIVAGAASNNFAITVMATEALGVDDNSLDRAISIFPNPIKNVATIAFLDNVNPKQAKIFDINGKLVAQKYTYNLENNFKMDLGTLSAGTYFLHFEAEEGTVIKQLIKQ